ncbi:MAG: GntR family transcriptional regulator [Clostridia bacterium]|nr:GntR family transcriptional regulator [Clostridia bacterium]
MSLERNYTALPLYVQIARELEEKILSGEYAPGQIIPSEKQLQETYLVSRMTVRLAIKELVNKGYLECMRGIGTTVVYGKIEENLHHVTSFTEEMQQHGITMRTRYCTIEETTAPDRVASAFGLTAESPVYRLVRVRCAEDVPMAYSVTYLNIPDLPMSPEYYTDSLYAFLSEKKGIRVTRGEDTLEAVLADSTLEKMLDIARHSPAFKRTRIAYDQDQHRIEYSISYYPGERYKYSVIL